MKCVRISNHKFNTEMKIADMEEAIRHLKSVVPRELHDHVRVEFDAEEGYGEYYVSVDVHYFRDDTAEEVATGKRLHLLAIKKQKDILTRPLKALEDAT